MKKIFVLLVVATGMLFYSCNPIDLQIKRYEKACRVGNYGKAMDIASYLSKHTNDLTAMQRQRILNASMVCANANINPWPVGLSDDFSTGGAGFGNEGVRRTSEPERQTAPVASKPASDLPYLPYEYTSTHYLEHEDVAGISKHYLRIMRNEIYARHGYVFKSKDLRDFFEAKPWYHGYETNSVIVEKEFSDIERYNIQFIKKYE